MPVSLPSAPQTYEAAIVEAIAKYLDRILFADSNPTSTIWDDPSGSIAPQSSGQLSYSGWIGISAIRSPNTASLTTDRNSIEIEITFRIAGNDVLILPALAADRARQLQDAVSALARDPIGDISGTYRGFTFASGQTFKIQPSGNAWSITTVYNQGKQANERGGVSIIRRSWLIEVIR